MTKISSLWVAAFLAFQLSAVPSTTHAFAPRLFVSSKIATTTRTRLFSTTDETSVKRKKPLSPAEILQQQGLQEEEAPKLFSESLYDDMQSVLLALEKRVAQGAGALSETEFQSFHQQSQRILLEMKNFVEPQVTVAETEKEVETTKVEATTEATPPSSPPPAASQQATSTKVVVAALEPDGLSVAETVAPRITASEPAIPNVVIASEEEAVIQPEAPAQYSPEPVVVEEDEKIDTTTSAASSTDLRVAVSKMDSKTVDELLEKGGLEMDESTTNAAFWAVVKAVDDAEASDQPLSRDVPRMLHHICEADLQHLLKRQQIRTNVTCMQPRDDGVEGRAQAMSYIFDDSAHKDLPLEEGRRCEDGQCCDACSRNIFPTFATENESSLSTFPEIASFTFNNLRSVSSASILQFARLVERVRRTISHEYGVPLKTILPLQAYSRKYVAGTTQQGGGGGEGDFVTLHTDEATHSGYHYSCVLYLSTSGEDFEGGDFVFNDPAPEDEQSQENDDDKEEEEGPVFIAGESPEDHDKRLAELAEKIRRAGRKLTPYSPTRGAAVIFSSGWENMHEVEKITSGIRYAVPCFFTTCPVPEAAYEQMVVGKPSTDEEIADDWLHLLLAHRRETPQEAMGRVKELLMKWHYMCAPLSEH